MCRQKKRHAMKRIITFVVLGHWLLFFAFHSLGALAGSLTIASISGLSDAVALFGANGASRSMPLISAGLGTASLLVATLFLWALLANVFAHADEATDGEVEKIAFGGAILVFTVLSALSIIDAEPTILLASTGCFAALILSWLATRVEVLEDIFSHQFQENSSHPPSQITSMARSMASSAAHQNLLAKIAGRERI
jgi:hypothetical protein